MTHPASGNATWQDYPSTTTLITAQSLENIEFGLDKTKWAIRTVSANTQAVNNEKLYVDASGGARTISEPANPAAGMRLFVFATAASTTNTVTLNWTINGDATGIIINASQVGVHVSHNGSGWFIDYPTTTAGRLVGGNAPASAGFRSGYYSTATNQYYPQGKIMQQLRSYLRQAATGSLIDMVCAGDSRTAGYIASSTPNNAYPSRLRSIMAAAGIPSAGTGLVLANGNTVTDDNRFTFSANWSAQGANYFYRGWTASGATATFTSDVVGSVVEVYYYSNSGTFNVKVGALTAVGVTPSGTGVNVQRYQVTGQSVAVGTQIVITSTSASGFVIGVNIRATSGLVIHTAAYGGLNSNQLAATGNITMQQLITFINPQILSIMIGVNDPAASISLAQHTTNMSTITQTNNPNPAKVLICESPNSTYEGSWAGFVSAQYDVADYLKVPLLDINDRWGSSTIAMNAGLLGSDALHETVPGQEELARSVARILTT